MVTEEPKIADNAKLNTTQAAKLLGMHHNTLRIKAQHENLIPYSVGKSGRPVFTGKAIKKFWREY